MSGNKVIGELIQRKAWERYCKDTELDVNKVDNFWVDLNRGVQLMYLEVVLVEEFGLELNKKRYRHGS